MYCKQEFDINTVLITTCEISSHALASFLPKPFLIVFEDIFKVLYALSQCKTSY